MNLHIANILDIEATCYENGIFPPGEQQEIIEIGLCQCDLRSRKIISTLNILVTPTSSNISPYCTALTGWTYDKLKRQGVPLYEACRRLRDRHGARNRLLVTDSCGDTELFRSQCQLRQIDYPFGPNHLNLATMFALLTGLKHNLGLETMLSALDLKFEGQPHHASHDARNIAKLFLKILERGQFTPDISATTGAPTRDECLDDGD